MLSVAGAVLGQCFFSSNVTGFCRLFYPLKRRIGIGTVNPIIINQRVHCIDIPLLGFIFYCYKFIIS